MKELDLIKKSSLINSDKESILTIVDNYIEDVAHNGGDILKDWIMCEKYSLMISKMKEALKPYIINEISKYDYNKADMFDCEMKLVNAASRYDFSNNEAWIKQKTIVDSETNKLKNIEQFIKSLKDKASIVDEDTGEIVEYYPATKIASETIKTTLR